MICFFSLFESFPFHNRLSDTNQVDVFWGLRTNQSDGRPVAKATFFVTLDGVDGGDGGVHGGGCFASTFADVLFFFPWLHTEGTSKYSNIWVCLKIG